MTAPTLDHSIHIGANLIDMAFTGNFRGGIWNAQGLFACRAHKQEAKMAKIFQLMKSRDFVVVTETHSTAGKARAYKETLRQAGIEA